MLKVGSLQNGTDVFLSDKSPNRHISVLGISGSGKTVRLRELIRNVVENGETALIFDINGTDYKDCIDRVNVISAREDGFNTNLLEVGSDDAESEICHVMSIVQVLCRAFGLGCKQEEALRNAILYAVHHKKEDESELVAIKTGLQIQETTVAQKMRTIIFPWKVARRTRKHVIFSLTGKQSIFCGS